jgi:hypothetical protein
MPFKVVDQSREGPVEIRQQLPGVIVKLAERCSAVAIPGDTVEDRVEHVDRDRADPRTDELSRHATASTQSRQSIFVAGI